MVLLKLIILYSTGILTTSTALNHLRTKAVLRESIGQFTDFDVVRMAVAWPVTVPFIGAISVASLPMAWKVMKDELKKKKELEEKKKNGI